MGALDMKRGLKLVITVDVEEEGLFSGRYPRVPPGVGNVRELGRIEFVTRDFGLPLTLLVTYPVALDPECGEVLDRWRGELGAEIGAHLHPWSTPPFVELPGPEPFPSDLMPESLLEAKLATLSTAIRGRWGVKPSSFRMGRFDLGRTVRRLLPTFGIRTDSSLVPFRFGPGAADHFMAPNEPFWLDEGETGEGRLLEVPLTQVALMPNLAARAYELGLGLDKRRRFLLLSMLRTVAVVGIQPAWFPLASMLWAARLHGTRGGRVLTLFLHSSELLPGATPSYPSEASVQRLTRRIRLFLQWLTNTYSIEGVTLSRLHSSVHAPGNPSC
jgi:hypothetical protein